MNNKQIFVISPIGKKESEKFKKFDAVLKTMIKPAIEEIDKEFKIIRADQTSQPGSFIKDILEQLESSYIVIANLTELNANVFYELGVRHTLSNRTIMITEDIDSLPSDLKEYRVIEYSAELTAVETFKVDLKKAFKEILDNPDKSDNPVRDRLPSIIEKRENTLYKEVELLKQKLQEKISGKQVKTVKYIETRVQRILNLLNAGRASTNYDGITWTRGKEPNKSSLSVPIPWGNFRYYFVNDRITKFITHSLIISIRESSFDIDEELSDIRVMVKEYGNKDMIYKFVIATNQDMKDHKKRINDFFKKAIKFEKLLETDFTIEIWDEIEILKIEKELGLK